MRFFILTFLAIGCFSCKQNNEYADTIFMNGKIYTLSDRQAVASAIAVKNGIILEFGELESVDRYKGDSTQIVDLKGSTMTPGFIEGHAHFMGVGFSQMQLDLMQVSSYEELIDMVADAASELEPGEWIQGRGWHQDKWDSISGKQVRGFPVHTMLSEVSRENPVFLRHASGHAALANAKAMELANINANTEFDEGGEIIKDASGNPTGILNETAQALVGSLIPQNSPKKLQKAFEEATRTCLENGITNFHDAGIDQTTIDLYKKNLDNGNMKVRLYAMLSGSDHDLIKKYFEHGPEIGLGNDFLTIRSIKLYSDGALGSRGAWLLEEYEDMHGEFGHSTTPIEEISGICNDAVKYDFQICTHAIGDRANREVLDKYEQAFTSVQKPSDEMRFRIEHAQHLHPEDIPRFSQLGVIPAMQAIHMSSDRPWAINRLGEKRIIEGAYVWQKLLQSGVKIVNGTDAPVEPINPIACFYASVTRKTLSGNPPEGYEPKQKMTRDQALRSYTIDAAYGAFEEDIKGSIEVGKVADFTVFSRDIMQIQEDEILDTEIVMTVVAGNVQFSNL